jgi:toxin YoeB
LRLLFSARSWDEYQHWVQTDPTTLERVNRLILECRRSPFRGTGKPEPLKGEFHGWWSRRITQEDRLVYRVSGSGDAQTLEIAQCRFHY